MNTVSPTPRPIQRPIRKIALISPNPRLPDFESRLVMAENALLKTCVKMAFFRQVLSKKY